MNYSFTAPSALRPGLEFPALLYLQYPQAPEEEVNTVPGQQRFYFSKHLTLYPVLSLMALAFHNLPNRKCF